MSHNTKWNIRYMRYETNMSLHFVGSFLLSRLQFGLSSCNINCFIKELFRKCYNSQDFYTAVCNNRKNAFYSPCLRVWDIATWNNWCTDAESLPCTSNNSVRMVLRLGSKPAQSSARLQQTTITTVWMIRGSSSRGGFNVPPNTL